MGYYYIRGKKKEFDDACPPKYDGGIVQFNNRDGYLVLERMGLKQMQLLFITDNLWAVGDITIAQLNELYESGKAKFAEPALVERIGPRV